MGQEQPKQLSPEEIEAMRKRVETLRETDNPYQDSIHQLAKEEGRHREGLQADNVQSELVGKYGDIHSTAVLEKMEAEKEVWIDKLTGLRNRRALEEEIPQFLKLERSEPAEIEKRGFKGKEKRKTKNCSLLMLDLDNFKEVNETFGHPAGDAALKTVAEIIGSNIREGDFIYRYGGEEFTVFLPDTEENNAVVVAEKIRAKLESSTIQVRDNLGNFHDLVKTISIGCVGTGKMPEWKKSSKEITENEILKMMIRHADLALKISKDTGKNKITAYDTNMEKKK